MIIRTIRRLFGGQPSDGSGECPYALIGTYPVFPDRKHMGTAARYYGYDYLVTKSGLIKAKEVSEIDLKGLTLVEIEVTGPIVIAEIVCRTRGTEQVPYLEYYLDVDGCTMLFHSSKKPRPDMGFKEKAELETHMKTMKEARRLCFFMHFLRKGSLIDCNGHKLRVTQLEPLPARLEEHTHYVPVG